MLVGASGSGVIWKIAGWKPHVARQAHLPKSIFTAPKPPNRPQGSNIGKEKRILISIYCENPVKSRGILPNPPFLPSCDSRGKMKKPDL
jgi:hypothetical protein